MESNNPKITAGHLDRKAIVYLRQSSLAQVRNNLESQRLQYALADRARDLGWQEVEVIDSDLGASASLSSARAGFEHLVSKVALGQVGIVMAREASRLSRTDKDWCHLLEVCQAFRTLIGDEDHIYDLEMLDDQLVLGIKGTLSVVELKVLKMRLLEGKEEKARRGELFTRLPSGYPGRYAARYYCRGNYHEGGNMCLAFGGAKVDRRIAEEVLQVISPLGLKASFKAMERMRSVYSEQHRSLSLELEQVNFEVQRAFEQYDEVDARNRLVAAELESRWNAKLEQQARLRREIAELEAHEQPLGPEDERKIRALGENFARVWNDKNCPIELKKKIVNTVIEEVVASLHGETMRFVIHWKGGVHTQLKVPKRQLDSSSRTPEEALAIIRKLAPRYGDDRIASVLNRSGFQTGKGLRWTQMRVTSARRNYGIRGHLQTPERPNLFNRAQAAEYCGVGPHIIQRMVDDGTLTNEQEVPMAPWELRRAELDSEPVRRWLDLYRRTGKYPEIRGCGAEQLELST